MKLIIPEGYNSILDLKQTERAIKEVKDFFESSLSSELKLRRVTAPLFVMKGTGINDDLNGIERPVSFPIRDLGNATAEIVQSLAKWKRMMLCDYDIRMNYGIYTDMNALRPDEELDNLHSVYVDQWDWERVISKDDRKLEFLKDIVNRVYQSMVRTEFVIYEQYPEIEPILPENITFFHAEELLEMYPDLTPRQREDKVAEKYGAVFIIGIGGVLADGKAHDGRAPDYDDWTTPTVKGYKGLNGDIILWNPILKMAFEVSSMGIRVDKAALEHQLKITGLEERKNLQFHRRLLNDELPESIGGGIGQSRLCMFFLRKAHVGEIQSSVWPGEMVAHCKKSGIILI
ncbi:MAG: aspartate--ammonia ligase [Bacteroidales bacterium]|nr:aspartate--ammonia ligase [Bacteroidales bacterium]MCB9013967.1 aspartate--ammonia ligase [Bacteroidales bacterium]